MSQIASVLSLDVLWVVGRALSLFAAFLVFAWAFGYWRRAAAKDAQRVFEQLDLVRAELLIMKEVMHSAAHRVDTIAQRNTQEIRIPTPTPGGARGYEIAARMARNGSAREELIRSCGLTAHEADLLIKLHGQKAVAPGELIGRQIKAPAVAVPAKPAVQSPVQSSVQSSARAAVQANVRAPAPQRPQAQAPSRAQPRSRLVAVG